MQGFLHSKKDLLPTVIRTSKLVKHWLGSPGEESSLCCCRFSLRGQTNVSGGIQVPAPAFEAGVRFGWALWILLSWVFLWLSAPALCCVSAWTAAPWAGRLLPPKAAGRGWYWCPSPPTAWRRRLISLQAVWQQAVLLSHEFSVPFHPCSWSV